MDVPREALHLLRRVEADVVVAVRRLRRAARIDSVHLAADLVVRPQPGFATEGDRIGRVVGGHHVGVAPGSLLVRVLATTVPSSVAEVDTNASPGGVRAG